MCRQLEEVEKREGEKYRGYNNKCELFRLPLSLRDEVDRIIESFVH